MASLDERITDVEKGTAFNTSNPQIVAPSAMQNHVLSSHDPAVDVDEPLPTDNKALQWLKRFEHLLGLEVRGIHRVHSSEQSAKTTLSFLNIVVLWFSINTAPQNITLASIGQEVYGLGFVDATLCSVFGAVLGSIPVAYTAGWGPWSGNRTLVRWIEFRVEKTVLMRVDLCKILNGMVASEDMRLAQSSRADRIRHD